MKTTDQMGTKQPMANGRKITAVHCYGNKRDITSHPSEARHSLAVEIAGADHPIDIADIPLGLTSAMDDGPTVVLTEADTLAIGDEIARRCNSYEQAQADKSELLEMLKRCHGMFQQSPLNKDDDWLSSELARDIRKTIAKALNA